jgi:hypothetical protein
VPRGPPPLRLEDLPSQHGRIITAVALQTTRIWGDRRYLDMSLLKKEATAAEAVA